MTDREERQHVIEILQKEKKTALHDNKWAFDYAIASIKTDLKYDLLYEETSGQADKPTTKNYSEVSSELDKNSKKLEKDFGELDCISRAQTQTKIEMNSSRYTIAKERGGMGQVEWSDQLIKVSDAVDIIRHLPPVTPIRPKGHWKLVQRGKSIDICCSNCEEVRIKNYAYNYTIDQLDKEDLKECFECADMRYCPNCGVKMVESQKSEE